LPTLWSAIVSDNPAGLHGLRAVEMAPEGLDLLGGKQVQAAE
jgi:hypothetical protein